MKNKLVGILLILVMLIVIMPCNVFADYSGINTDIDIGNTAAIKSSVDITERIVRTLQTAGTVISIIALIIIGMRYMFSSVEEKAQMKGVLGYYIAGCVLVFATSNVLSFAYNVIGDLEHTYKVVSIQQPTCTKPGSKNISCTECGKTAKIDLNPLGHQYGNWEVMLEATCSQSEILHRTCGRCSFRETNNTGRKAPHTWSDWTEIRKATCGSSAIHSRTCSVCSETEQKTVGSPLPHTWEKWKLAYHATCASPKIENRKCTMCNKYEYREVGSRLSEHNWSEWQSHGSADCTSAELYMRYCFDCMDFEQKYVGAPDPSKHISEKTVYSYSGTIISGKHKVYKKCSGCNNMKLIREEKCDRDWIGNCSKCNNKKIK